jgi:hypothetical protein
MIGLHTNDQKLQVSIHRVMRRKLLTSARGCSPPGHLFCTTLGENAGLVSDRAVKERGLPFTRKRTSITALIEAAVGIPER